jgi:hypothetical protein
LKTIARYRIAGKRTHSKNILYGMAHGKSFDSGAGLSFPELVNLARNKGLVEVGFKQDGSHYLYLVAKDDVLLSGLANP